MVLTQPSTKIDFSKVEPLPPEMVLALDPGKTTGFCFGVSHQGMFYLAPGEKAFTLYDFHEMLWSLWLKEGEIGRCHIVYEDFTYRNAAQMGLDLTPVKFQGIIELYKERWESFVTFDKQNPSVQGEKAFYTDAELKRLGLYWAHGKGHARSATKHLLQWANFGAGGQYINMEIVEPQLVELDWLLDTYYHGLRI